MATIKRVTIPEPCVQQWHQIMPNNNGRHCDSCNKTVVDFTLMTNREIISYLSNSGSVCGRLSKLQLDGVNRQLASSTANNTTGWKKWMVAATLLTCTIFTKAIGQSTEPAAIQTEQGPVTNFPLGKIAMPVAVEKTIEGQVVDEQNIPLIGVEVMIKGTRTGAVTDVNGNSRISAMNSDKVLVFKYIGYETTEKKIKHKDGKPAVIKLKMGINYVGRLRRYLQQAFFY